MMQIHKNASLGDQISKKMSTSMLTLAIIITVGAIMISYAISRQIFNHQVNTWLAVAPRNALDDLIDSDYFSIVKEVNLLESTRLFSSFYIADNQHQMIAGFGKPANETNSIPITDQANVVWGYYSFSTDFLQFFSPFLVIGGIFIIAVFLLFAVVRKRIKSDIDKNFIQFKRFLTEIETATDCVGDLDSDKITIERHEIPITLEQEMINRSITRLFEEIRKSNIMLREAISSSERKKYREELTRNALQVAHDIGSPLAVLETIVQSSSTTIPEENRVYIQNAAARIRDISNSLLRNARHDNAVVEEGQLSRHLIASLINILVSEKRFQYHGSNKVIINLNIISHDLFSFLKVGDFNRVLSNLINNSVEAIEINGKIDIALYENADFAIISVTDNGKGMPGEILTNLGKAGVTYGKLNGVGLGLNHAINTVEDWGGKLEVESKLGEGTTVRMFLPKSVPPDWFVSGINIAASQKVVIIDDDDSIHNVWRLKFSRLYDVTGTKVSLKHFYSPDKFISWLSSADIEDCLFLCDYEFINYPETGISLINKLSLGYQAILVTSKATTDEVLSGCIQNKIKLIPKDMVNFIPILIINH